MTRSTFRCVFSTWAVAAALLVAGCSGFSLHPSYAWLPGKIAGIKVLAPQWHRPLVLNKERSYNPYEGGSVLADPESGKVYIGTSAGRFYALDSATGQMVWKFTSGDAINSTPILSPDRKDVFFGNDAGRLFRLDTETGKKIFEYDGSGEVRSKPLLSGRALFFKDIRGRVHAVSGENGKGLWMFQWEPPEGYVVESTAGVAIVGQTVLTGFYDGLAVGIRLIEGTEKWRTDLSEFVPEDMQAASAKIDVNTTPVVAGDQVLYTSFRGGLFGLDPEDGSILWRRSDLRMTSGLTVEGDEIYVSVTSKGLMRLSLEEHGKTTWDSRFSCKTLSSAVVYGDLVVVTDSAFGLIILSRETGQVLDRFTPMWGSSAPPEVKSGRIFLHSNGGSVYSFFIL
jgi:outer membrane protein assembly factor BamB